MQDLQVAQVRRAVENFRVQGDFLTAKPYGSGHINETLLAKCRLEDGSELPLTLQRINTDIFTNPCLLYTSPSPRDVEESRMPSSA